MRCWGCPRHRIAGSCDRDYILAVINHRGDAVLLLFKSHVKGYAKKDGTYVAPHETKVVKKAPQKALFDPKAPLPAEAYAGKDLPAVKPAEPVAPAKKPGSVAAENMAQIKDALSKPKAKGWVNSLHSGKKFGKDADPYAASESKAPQLALFGGSKASAPSKPHYPNAIKHPQPDEHGKPFRINEPSKATDAATWSDAKAVAIFTPGSAVPESLHGVAIAPWTDHPKTAEGWEFVDGINHALEEPPLVNGSKNAGAGVVIEEPDGRVWIISPSNQFAGYKNTFPKGTQEPGMSLQASAIKECFEESGLKVEIVGMYGDVERDQSVARYYKARRVGGSPAAMGWESQAVQLVPKDKLHALLNRSADRAVAELAGVKAPPPKYESADKWEQVGKQAGSNPGGVYKDASGAEWYVKIPKSSNIAKNEVLAGKLYEAAGVAVPELKHVTVGDKLAIASKMVPGLKKLPHDPPPSEIEGVMDGFAVDAWLANWDVVGLAHDNLLVTPEGKAVRVDVGGSLVYRAQGEPKGAHFGDKVGELQTLTNGMNPQSAAVFGGITKLELKAGIDKVAAVPDDKIRSLCMEYGPGTKEQRAELGDKLVKRKAFLLALENHA